MGYRGIRAPATVSNQLAHRSPGHQFAYMDEREEEENEELALISALYSNAA
jgi:hypothetical protein